MRAKLLSLGLVVSLGMATTAAAQVATYDSPRQEAVRYHELDLTTAAGADALKHRVATAAKRTCGPEPALIELKSHRTYTECVSTAQSNAALAVARARAQRAEATRPIK